jgi:hypothetical protein
MKKTYNFSRNLQMISPIAITNLANHYLQDTTVDNIPRIVFDEAKNLLRIEGESYHEYSIAFFQPMLSFLEAFTQEYPQEKLTVEFKMSYFNTGTSRRFVELFDILEKHHQQGGHAWVNWYYDETDIDILDSGKDFKDKVSFCFELIAY